MTEAELRAMYEEIGKCDIVCCNCHAKIHAGVTVTAHSPHV